MALDPIPIACEIVGAIQTYVTRQIPIFDPAVITVAKIEAGTTDNVVPETAFMLGTIRTLSKSTRQAVQVGLKRLAEGIAAAYGATADISVTEGFSVTVCDSRAVATARDAVQALYGPEAWVDQPSPVMGAEDFSYVLEKTPGAMMFLGAAPDGQDWRSCCPLHSNRLMLDESVMARGAAAQRWGSVSWPRVFRRADFAAKLAVRDGPLFGRRPMSAHGASLPSARRGLTGYSPGIRPAILFA